MASFRLCHRQTGTIIAGYRVLSATEDEIARANWRLRNSGSSYRFVIDLHPPTDPDPIDLCDSPRAANPEESKPSR